MSRRWTTLRNNIESDLTSALNKFNDTNVKKFFKTEQFNVQAVLDKMNADFEELSFDSRIEFNPTMGVDVHLL